LKRELFFDITPRNDNKKPVGIFAKDINLNLIKKHKLFLNEDFHKYLYVRPSKFEKVDKISSSKQIDLKK
jgi:hypothetical protein